MDWLRKISYTIKTDKKHFFLSFLLAVFIPNLTLFSICYHYGLSRTLINIDYFLPIILMYYLTFRGGWLISFSLFFLVFFIDVVLIILQLFPFIKLVELFYFSTFIFTGPIIYRYYLGILTILFFIEFAIIAKCINYVRLKAFIFSFLLLLIIKLLFIVITLINPNLDKSIINSQTLFMIVNHNENFLKIKQLKMLEPTRFDNATEPWFKAINNNKPLSNKLLLIVAESWGETRNSKAQEDLFTVLRANKDQLEFFNYGGFEAFGATVTGEMREICKLEPQVLHEIEKINEGFENCLPNLLLKRNYKTTVLYGGSWLMYGMTHWYPLAGFQQFLKGDDFNYTLLKDNNSAILEIDLIPDIAKSFNNNEKHFYYWLTNATHTPYSESIIYNYRFSCKQYNIDRNSETCRNLMLHTQFFDTLAKLVAMPEMTGVEVIVVGDHPPPIMNFSEGMRHFYAGKVGWVHFKIKDKPKEKTNDNNNKEILEKLNEIK